MGLWRNLSVAVLILVMGVAGVSAQDGSMEMDPLLELLVEQGVITMEQATAVQAEYDRRKALERGVTVEPAPEAPPVVAELEAPPAEKAKPEAEKWYDRFDFRGDLRLRHEEFYQDAISDDDQRKRDRIRYRAGVYTDVTDWMEVGFQLRSGDPDDPVSDNQSTDGSFSMKPIAISEVYAGFDAADWLDLTFGKFGPKNKWIVSDMQWDDDVTAEGAMEELSFGPFKANLYQYWLEEQKSEGDAYLIGGQLTGKFKTDSIGTFSIGAGYDDWVRPQLVADQTLAGDLKGNKVTNLLDDNDLLISDFKIWNASVKWSYSLSDRWPVKVSLFGYHNTGANGLGQDYDTGYFARFQVGDYKKKGQMMFRLSRYYSEPDAMFYVFAQSDTTRASDVDGYRFDFRVGYIKRSFFSLTWYHTDAVYADVTTMDRFMLDYIIKF